MVLSTVQVITMRAFLLLLLSNLPNFSCCWVPMYAPCRALHRRSTEIGVKNILSDIGDMLFGGDLVPQATLPYGKSLDVVNTDESTVYAVQERGISFSGEDFDVWDTFTNTQRYWVRGAMLHLPGKDKMRILGPDSQVKAILERKMPSLKPTYDIYRGYGNEKIGWIEKKTFALMDTFEVFVEAEKRGPFGSSTPAFKIEGDFLDYRFSFKNSKEEVVAKVKKDGWVQFDAFNHYQIEVAPGMDPLLVIACACAIDEEFDEEHKKESLAKKD
jgi:uncharacterized protein YxjI